MKFWSGFFAAAAPLLLAAAGPPGSRFRNDIFSLPLPSPSPSPSAPNAQIVVANGCSGDLTVYPLGSNGDASPLVTPRDFSPGAVAVDAQKNLYVLDACRQVINVYPPGSTNGAVPSEVIGNLDAGQSGFGGASDFALDSAGNIYVAGSSDTDFISIFAHGSTGNAQPIGLIIGPHTQLNGPESIAVDSAGKIYVANYFGSVTVYAAGSTGDASPIATIYGPHTGLPQTGPTGIAVDSQGNIYVMSNTYSYGGVLPHITSVVTVYASGANGDAAPIRTINGPDTGIETGWASSVIAVDASANLYVSNFSYTESTTGQQLSTSSSVEVFPPDANGDATPSAVISGPETELNLPAALAVDSSGNIYLCDIGYRGAVHVYPQGSHGNAKPSLTLGGPSIIDYFRSPTYAAADSHGNVYVLSVGGFASPAIEVHKADNLSGDPIATISGPNTHMEVPSGLAVGSNGEIYVSNYNHEGTVSSILIYAPGTNGNEPPISVVSGPNTGLFEPYGVAIAPNGMIFAANSGPYASSVTAYLPGHAGDSRPFGTIFGPATQLSFPTSMAFDSASNVYIESNCGGCGLPSIGIFPAGQFGNVAPVEQITGPDTGIWGGEIAVDSSGRIYSANGSFNNVAIYAPGSNGDTPPSAVISGPHTGIGFPVGIVIAQPESAGGRLQISPEARAGATLGTK